MADSFVVCTGPSHGLSEHFELGSRSQCLLFVSQILVHLGLLTKESGFKIAETAFSGGPLGELVQWSDLITSLYLLGHDIRISASLAELKE
jgi:hypothetical protein